MLPANGGNKRAILLKEIPKNIKVFFREQYSCFGHLNEDNRDPDLMIYVYKSLNGEESVHFGERFGAGDQHCKSSILLSNEILEELSKLSAAELKFTIQSLINASGTNKQ